MENINETVELLALELLAVRSERDALKEQVTSLQKTAAELLVCGAPNCEPWQALTKERDKYKIDSAAWEEAHDEVVKERDSLKERAATALASQARFAGELRTPIK